MADGAKLMSGYIELTVKTGDAMQEITAAITGLDKEAEKAGRRAGEALERSLSKGAKDAGRAVSDELTSAAEKAGTDAGDAIGKGVEKGAKAAGQKVGDELGKAAKKASRDVESVKIEPKITPKVDKPAARKEAQSIPQIIREEADKAARNNGYDGIEDVMVDIGSSAGAKLGTAINTTLKKELGVDLGGAANTVRDVVGNVLGDSFNNIDFGSVLNNTLDHGLKGSARELAKGAGRRLGQRASDFAQDQLIALTGVNPQEVVDTITGIRTSYTNAKGGDLSAIGGGPANAFTDTLGGAGDILSLVGDVGDSLGKDKLSKAGKYGTALTGGAQLLNNAMTDAPEGKSIGSILAEVAGGAGFGAAAGSEIPLIGNGIGAIIGGGAEILHNWDAIGQHMPWSHDAPKSVVSQPTSTDHLYDSVFGAGASAAYNPAGMSSAGEVAVTTPIAEVSAGSVSLGGNISLPANITAGMTPKMSAPAASAVPKTAGAESSSTASLYGSGGNSMLLGKYSGGGVAGLDKDGKLIGPGTGTSDSILGVDPGGMPTALVSRGEGVVNNDAMLNGAGPIVSALNAGTPPDQLAVTAQPAGFAERTQGYIPAGAGASGQAGTSFASGLYQMGAQAINGLIDQAAGAAAGAAGAMSFGAGGGAAGAAIGIGTQAAKRGVEYGAQMAGIATDAAAEILMPFGVPRWFQTDPSQFMPQFGIQPAAVTTGEKAQTPGADPGGPVQPGQLAGAQPVAAPAALAKPEGMPSVAAPIGSNTDPVSAPGAPAGPAIGPPMPQSGPPELQPVDDDPNNPYPAPLLSLSGFAKGGVVGIYDTGGMLPAGGIALNQSKRPEPVFNHEQWGVLQDNLARTEMGTPDPAAIGGGSDYSMNFEPGSIVVKDVAELEQQMASRQRLRMMQHAGRP